MCVQQQCLAAIPATQSYKGECPSRLCSYQPACLDFQQHCLAVALADGLCPTGSRGWWPQRSSPWWRGWWRTRCAGICLASTRVAVANGGTERGQQIETSFAMVHWCGWQFRRAQMPQDLLWIWVTDSPAKVACATYGSWPHGHSQQFVCELYLFSFFFNVLESIQTFFHLRKKISQQEELKKESQSLTHSRQVSQHLRFRPTERVNTIKA